MSKKIGHGDVAAAGLTSSSLVENAIGNSAAMKPAGLAEAVVLPPSVSEMPQIPHRKTFLSCKPTLSLTLLNSPYAYDEGTRTSRIVESGPPEQG